MLGCASKQHALSRLEDLKRAPHPQDKGLKDLNTAHPYCMDCHTIVPVGGYVVYICTKTQARTIRTMPSYL